MTTLPASHVRWLCDPCTLTVTGHPAQCEDCCNQHLDHNGPCDPRQQHGEACDRCGGVDRLTEVTEEYPAILHPVFPLPIPVGEVMAHVVLPGDYMHRLGREVSHTVHAYTLTPVADHDGRPTGAWTGRRQDYMSSSAAWGDSLAEVAAELRSMARLEAQLALEGAR